MGPLLLYLAILPAVMSVPFRRNYCDQAFTFPNGTWQDKISHLSNNSVQIEKIENVVAFKSFSAIIFQFQMPSAKQLQVFKVSRAAGVCNNTVNLGNSTEEQDDLCSLYQALEDYGNSVRTLSQIPDSTAFKAHDLYDTNLKAPTCDDVASPFGRSEIIVSDSNNARNKVAQCSNNSSGAQKVLVSLNPGSKTRSLESVFEMFGNMYHERVFDGVRMNDSFNKSISEPIYFSLLTGLEGLGYTELVTEIQRWKDAAGACSERKLPNALISKELWEAELQNLRTNMSSNAELPLDDLYDKYADSNLVDCVMVDGKLEIRVVVPLIVDKVNWTVWQIWSETIEENDDVRTCMPINLIGGVRYAVDTNGNVVEMPENNDHLVRVPSKDGKNRCGYYVLRNALGEDQNINICKHCHVSCF